MRQPINEDMSKVGIAPRFHHKTLAEVPGGEELTEWFKLEGPAIAAGKSFILTGTGALASEHLMLIARACFMSRITTKVVSLVQLAEAVVDNPESVRRPNALFIRSFQDERDTPLTRRETTKVEDFLDARLTFPKATFFEVYGKLPAANFQVPLKWWGNRLVETVRHCAVNHELGLCEAAA